MSTWGNDTGLAIPPGAKSYISTSGLCNNDQPHDGHVFWDGIISVNGSYALWDCPGQYSECRNCDDRKCMDCVLRYWHDVCEDSCPMCCEKER